MQPLPYRARQDDNRRLECEEMVGNARAEVSRSPDSEGLIVRHDE
jgi:hypothetical protein